MKISVIKHPDCLKPVTPSDWDKFNTVKNGLRTVIDLKGKRNIKLFDKWWSIMRMIYNNQKELSNGEKKWKDEHDVSECLLIAKGFYTKQYAMDGTVFIRADRINFESCSGEKFEKIWKECVPLILKELGITEQELNENTFYYL